MCVEDLGIKNVSPMPIAIAARSHINVLPRAYLIRDYQKIQKVDAFVTPYFEKAGIRLLAKQSAPKGSGVAVYKAGKSRIG
jgi:hypothetical protein